MAAPHADPWTATHVMPGDTSLNLGGSLVVEKVEEGRTCVSVADLFEAASPETRQLVTALLEQDVADREWAAQVGDRKSVV